MEKTPAEVIKEKGVETFAEKLGKRRRTIEMWRTRNRLPRASWPEIIVAFPDLDLEALKAIEARSGARSAA